jgi:hypothetical protein
MSELTLESLAQRVATLEALLLPSTPDNQTVKDWRKNLGTVTDTDFMRQVDALGKEYRESQRYEDET